jgi:hypothetical protein
MQLGIMMSRVGMDEKENVYGARVIFFGVLSILVGQLGFTLSNLPGVGLGIPSYLNTSIAGLFSVVMIYNYVLFILYGARTLVRSRRTYVEGVLDILSRSSTYKEFFSLEKRDEILAGIESDLLARVGFWSRLDIAIERINLIAHFGVPLLFGALVIVITSGSIGSFAAQLLRRIVE